MIKVRPPNADKQHQTLPAPHHSQQLREESKYLKFLPHLRYRFNRHPAPEEFMECTKHIYLPRVRKDTLTGDERTRTRLGHPSAAGPQQPDALGGWCARHSPERPWGCSDVPGGCSSLWQPLQTGSAKAKFNPPLQPCPLATPALCLPLWSPGTSLLSLSSHCTKTLC